MKTQMNKFVFMLAIAVIALTGINAKASSRVVITEVEPAMEIENWMVDETFWNKEMSNIEPASEKELAIEGWMIDEKYWE